MEKEKKEEKNRIAEGLGKNPDSLTVQKSQPLLSLWHSGYQLNAYKLLDLYLSRIDSRHPETRTIVLERGEIEKVLGVVRLENRDLMKILKNMMQTVELPHVDDKGKQDKNKIDVISLFERASADRSDDGLWKITLECTQSAMKYVFSIENLGYLRYKLNAVKNLRSRYSYILFNYLEANRFRKSWDIPLDELKKILRCDDTPAYSEYKRFSQAILKRSQKELKEKSGCIFSYYPVKSGQYHVVAVHFELESINIPENINCDDYSAAFDFDATEFPTSTENTSTDILNFFAEAVDNEFSDIQMQELIALIGSIPRSKLPQAQTEELARFDYLRQKFNRMRTQNEKKKIQNRYNYLLKILQNDIHEE